LGKLEDRIGSVSRGTGPLVFISYAHEEKHWLERLRVYLKQYEAAGEFERWDDAYIKVGDEWRREITGALARARIGVLLASTPFLASDFIRTQELPALLAATASGALRIICVPVSAGDFAHSGLTAYQWSRSPDQPLDRLTKPRRNQELVRIAREIRDAALACPATERLSTAPPAPYIPLVAKTERLDRRTGRLYGVPALPPFFVSREGPTRAVKRALLSGTTSVALCGVGGSGKSVLASDLVRDPELLSAFPDGVYWLTLGEAPALATLLQQFLGWLAPANVPDDLSQLREALRAALENRSCLLVLDDLWRASDAFAFDVLGAQCRVLVTTRNRGLAEAIHAETVSVEAVSDEEAVELMARRSGVSPSDLPEMTRPLTLVAAQVSSTCSWDAVSKAFDRALTDYDQDQTGSVFSAMQVSIGSLDVDRRERLFDLAIFPEDAEVPTPIVLALWESAGLSRESGARLIDFLADRNLVHRAEGGIRLHDLQRDYLHLRVEDLAQIHGRLLDAYVRTLEGQWAKLPTDNRYLWKHLAYHLAAAERPEELQQLLLDPSWAAERIRLDGVASLVADFEYVAAIPGMLEVQAAIRQSAHVFAADRLQLPSQLAGRVARKDLRATRYLHERLAFFGQWPWLRPLSASLVPPPGLQRTFEVEPGDASTLAIGRDERLFAGTSKGQIRSWDVATGAEFRPLADGLGFVHSVRVTVSGERLLSASVNGGLQLWELSSGRLLWQRQFDADVVRAEPIADDGSRAIIELQPRAESDGGVVRLFDFHDAAAGWTTGGCHRMVAATGAGVALAIFHDKELRKIDIESGRALASVLLPMQPTGIAIRSDGGMCASGDAEGRVYIWDGHQAPFLLGREQDNVRALAFAPAPDELLAADGILPHFVLWNIPSRQRRLAFLAHGWAVQALIPGVGAHEFASAADKTIKLWNLDSAMEQRADPVHHTPIPATAFSSDGRVFASGGNDGRVAVWTVERGTLMECVLNGGPRVRAVWVSADAARVAWWNDSNGCVVRAGGTHGSDRLRLEGVSAASFTQNVDCAVIVRADTQLSFWSLDSGLRELPGTKQEIRDVQIAQSGRWALSSHQSGVVRLWDLHSGEIIREERNDSGAQIAFWKSGDGELAGWLWPSGHASICELPAMTMSNHAWPKNRWLTADPSILIGHDDDPATTVVAHLDSNQELKIREVRGPISAGPDGRRLVAATPSFSRVLTIWDARTGDVVARFTAGEGEIHSPCWSPDGRVVVIAERVGTLHFLRLEGI